MPMFGELMKSLEQHLNDRRREKLRAFATRLIIQDREACGRDAAPLRAWLRDYRAKELALEKKDLALIRGFS